MLDIFIGLLLFVLGVFLVKKSLGKLKPNAPKFPIRWTVTLGLHKTSEEYEKALELSGFKITGLAREILKKIVCAQTLTEIQLGFATVAQLGLPKGGNTDQLHVALRSLGLELCPAEACPALFLLLLKGQSKTHWLWLMMLGDILHVFRVARVDNSLLLVADDGLRVCYWHPNHQIVFRIPNAQPA